MPIPADLPRASWVAWAALAAAACGDIPPALDAAPDPDAALAPDADVDAGGLAPDAALVADLAGTFLIGFQTEFGAVPLAWTVASEARQADGTYRITSVLQPLARAGLTPVGRAYVVPPTTVSAAGQVSFVIDDMVLPPPTTDTIVDVVYDARYLAMIVTPDLLCGTLPTGMVTAPIQASLSGLPWAGRRVPPGGPTPPLLTRCP